MEISGAGCGAGDCNDPQSALEPSKAGVYANAKLHADAALTADLSDLYRFALLLTGSEATAREVLVETLSGVHGELTQFRNDRHRTAWFVNQVRDRALARQESADSPDGAASESVRFAVEFSRLPEPERTALALFYLDFLTVRQIAHLLKLKLETISERLKEGRIHLRERLENIPESVPPL